MNDKIIHLKKWVWITSIVFVTLVIFLFGTYFLYERYPYANKLNPVCPNDFPEVLIPPENAEKINYYNPSNSSCAPHTCGLSFSVKEPYPAVNMRSFIEKILQSYGWRRLNFLLFNPEDEAKPVWSIDAIGTPGMEIHTWKEKWINDEEETITVILEYSFPEDAEKDFNSLFVNLMFFGRDSWEKPFISRYKKLHPEEFKTNTYEKD